MVANGVGGSDENKKFTRISKACRVSSVVEQRFCKPLVGSSNLSPGTSGLLTRETARLKAGGNYGRVGGCA